MQFHEQNQGSWSRPKFCSVHVLSSALGSWWILDFAALKCFPRPIGSLLSARSCVWALLHARPRLILQAPLEGWDSFPVVESHLGAQRG